jgi:hypothetical protein
MMSLISIISLRPLYNQEIAFAMARDSFLAGFNLDLILMKIVQNLIFLLFVATTIHLFSKASKISSLCSGNGLTSPEEFELNEEDTTVKNILDVSNKELILRKLLDMNEKAEFLADKGEQENVFKDIFGNTAVIGWLLCSVDNQEHRKQCEKFFENLRKV